MAVFIAFMRSGRFKVTVTMWPSGVRSTRRVR